MRWAAPRGVAVLDRRIYARNDDGGTISSEEWFDPLTGQWTAMPAAMHTLVQLDLT